MRKPSQVSITGFDKIWYIQQEEAPNHEYENNFSSIAKTNQKKINEKILLKYLYIISINSENIIEINKKMLEAQN